MRILLYIAAALALAFGAAYLYGAFNEDPPVNQAVQIETAPEADALDENPYGYEALPVRAIDPNGEEPFPMVTASDDGYNVIRASYVSVTMGNDYAGSGVIVRPGIVVTNAHVVYDEDGDLRSRRIRVKLLNGRSTSATVIGYSRTYDLAVLRVDNGFGEPARLADEYAYIGQRLLAVGNPSSGARQAYGNVLELDLPVRHSFVPDRTNIAVNMLVTTNRVVHGYSGGPMVDATTGVVYAITVGQVQYYNDPETGERMRVRPYAGAGMHIVEVMAEVDRILAAS